ncbi:MAG: preprotein translocase subunit SecA [Fusobacteriota bacterium]
MIKKLIQKVFGSKNEREINKIQLEVEEINALEPIYEKLSDQELKAKTDEFKKRIKNGEDLDYLRIEAFAVVREAAKRTVGMRHYDVQMIGGIVLHRGEITEMKTGEGKTLVATLPAYLNALTGKGVHIVTVNDYLAERDKDWMSKIYNFLGLTAGVLLNGQDTDIRKEVYKKDIVYGTNNEFGFDYLRDNMVQSKDQKVQRELNYAIVDEVDSILIDEARTPLIISGPSEETTKWYKTFYNIGTQLIKNTDYEVDEKASSITMTSEGIKKVESKLDIDNLYSPKNVELTHYLIQALKAKELFEEDKDYIVRDGEVVIVDEFTGRLMPGRRYSEGLHQAIEAKANVNIAGENQTLASITLQNYFRMYNKLSGMTGTAETEAGEFMEIYKLPVLVIPTNKPVIREDKTDKIYKTKREKMEAVIKKVVGLYKKGQPVLIGTASIESSEQLSEVLKRAKVPHEVLNAKQHEKEAEIVAQAGRYKSVTIATNMAGRGTDIVLGGNPEFMAENEVDVDDERYEEVLEKYEKQCKKERQKVLEAGGLYILGTSRNESRRIDNQLRGRAGRQGDPGASEFYLSLEDKLMMLFGSERVASVMDKLGLEDGEPIEHPMISKSIENAQKKVEGRNFSVRKQLLEYDDVMNKQREIIYAQRDEVLEKENLKDEIMTMLKDTVNYEVAIKLSAENREDWDVEGLKKRIEELFNYKIEEDLRNFEVHEVKTTLYSNLVDMYEGKEEKYSPEIMRKLENYILLDIVDSRWRENLKTLDSLKEGIHLRAYGQKDPVIEYKMLSSEIYADMIKTIKEEVVSYLFKIQIRQKDPEIERKKEQTTMYYNDSEEAPKVKQRVVNNKVGRNDPCPCGSGKKYKRCCGR